MKISDYAYEEGYGMNRLIALARQRARYPGDGCTLRSADRALINELADALERVEKALRQIVRDYCESEGKNPSDETVEMIIRQYLSLTNSS